MSWGLRASILVALDAYQGQWVPLAWLVRRLMVPADRVAITADALGDERLLQRGVVDGAVCYGVRVDAGSPLCTEAAA